MSHIDQILQRINYMMVNPPATSNATQLEFLKQAAEKLEEEQSELMATLIEVEETIRVGFGSGELARDDDWFDLKASLKNIQAVLKKAKGEQ